MKNPPPPPPLPQPEWVKFNLNDEIRVKLTEKGYQKLAQDFNKTLGEVMKELRFPPYYRKRADSEGYTEFQVWEFMRLFGPDLNVVDDYWDCNILVKSSSLKP